MIKTKYISKVNANMALCRTLCLLDNVEHNGCHSEISFE